ncbi:MAG: hypothetical protein OIF34_14635, partial [Porticoccaceae bacterium]|nr:hypothetical protein [Porticoccaceae bacterium]
MTLTSKLCALTMTAATLILGACSTTTTIDEYRDAGVHDITLNDNESMVILGRRHLGDHETEPGLISCIGKRLNRTLDVDVVPEQNFLNQMYPWFEPRTAPLKL